MCNAIFVHTRPENAKNSIATQIVQILYQVYIFICLNTQADFIYIYFYVYREKKMCIYSDLFERGQFDIGQLYILNSAATYIKQTVVFLIEISHQVFHKFTSMI